MFIIDDVFFIEGKSEVIKILGKVEYINYFNKEIEKKENVLRQLAQKTKNLGGNAIYDLICYKTTSGWIKNHKITDEIKEKWVAKGVAVIISNKTINYIKKQYYENITKFLKD